MKLVWFLTILVAAVEAAEVIINTGQGKIKGKELKARDGSPYTAFLGVPYAQPPIGDLRWRRPLPAQSWEGMQKKALKNRQKEFNNIKIPRKILPSST